MKIETSTDILPHVIGVSILSTKAQWEIAHKLKVFSHAEQNGNVELTCRYFGISRDTFYRWKKNYKSKGKIGLVNSKPCP